MRNPWRMQDGPDNKINRNNFPMSFQYNGTFKYGKIYPIGLWRTIPGASYQIDSTLALNFMPTTFPIQTRQRAYVHFYYGRDRNFWKDYKDFVNGMSPDLVKPYIDEGVTKARTGNLLDYLGVPTTLVGKYGQKIEYQTDSVDSDYLAFSGLDFNTGEYSGSGINSTVQVVSTDSLFSPLYDSLNQEITIARSTSLNNYCRYLTIDGKNDSIINITFNQLLSNGNLADLSSVAPATDNNSSGNQFAYASPTPAMSKGSFMRLIAVNKDKILVDIYEPEVNETSVSFTINGFNNSYNYYLLSPKTLISLYQYVSGSGSNYRYQLSYSYSGTFNYSYYKEQPEVQEINEITSPYWRSNDTRGKSTIKLSAIPPRMYETIYNLYYRNPQNNPYILNGKPEYNIFIPTKDGGADPNLYELRYRNWEDDFLTTAVQTPQQGIAPLVGLTDRGATVTLTNEDGSVTRYKTNLDEQGNVIGIETTDSSEPLLTQALIDAVSYGISIEDLRNVNAMQKWLELNLRKGYQYKDIIEARWGISISYNELDLPEFIGGFTQEVGLQAVTQTTSHGDTIEGALGWQAGRMYAAGSGRSITHYCEEEGYIMALLCVVPVPNYSQLLPKHWFTRDLLESYQPEFNHIGFQPITYKEVCPIQAFQESTENVDVLEQTFGYQRPWYEYFNQVDEVHGQFRTTFKDFLINRTFDVKPELSESFLLVDPNQVNDVFAVQTDDDKIIGAIEHRITAKLPISLYAQARLE